MKIRISSMMILSVAVGAGLVLFQTSQKVQRAESQLQDIQDSLIKERETVRVLEAEWDYLNRPDRIEELVRQHLKMSRPGLESLVSDSRKVPVPGAMIVPRRKPILATGQVLMPEETIAESAPMPAELPMPAPVTNDTRQQFNDLLNALTTQEPSAGEAP